MTWIKKNWMAFLALVAVLALTPLGLAGEKGTDKQGGGAKQKASGGTLGPRAEAPHRKVDLNTADRETLLSLPGVGPATADAIISARPFRNVAELKQVKGIGDVRYKELQKLVTVRQTAETPIGAPAKGAAGRSAEQKSAAPARSDERGSKNNQRSPEARVEGKINLNTATFAELESLPEIGPVKAQAIIDNRPYQKPEDVMRVKGIKEGTYDRIKDQITVR